MVHGNSECTHLGTHTTITAQSSRRAPSVVRSHWSPLRMSTPWLRHVSSLAASHARVHLADPEYTSSASILSHGIPARNRTRLAEGGLSQACGRAIKICFSRFCDGWLPGWPPTAGWGEAVGWASAHQGQPEAGWMGCRQRLTEKGSTRPGRGACCQRTSSQRCC